MKTIALMVLFAVGVVGVWIALGPSEGPAAAADSETEVSVFLVRGMTCGGCAVGLRTSLGRLDGVRKVEVSHEEGRAVVHHDPAVLTPEAIRESIERLGYEAELRDGEEE
jgi:P-type Cu+ transporter